MFVCLIALLLTLAFKVHGTRVEVEQGWLEGRQLELVTKDGFYYSFKGIPYAAPPLGKLRFKSPQSPLRWEGIRNASEHGSVCIQTDIFSGGNELVPSNEDCLFLNVYTPDLKPKSPLPVMFFIHGGGYASGSGNDDDYGPDFLVQHGVVLVTINYRLEVLGFLSLDTEEVPGNAGLKDQAAALKWVKKNIEKFGGDPDNITVFGQSAGGASTIYHMASPMSRTLFKRAISMSGVPSCEWSLSYKPRRRAFILGKQLGLDTRDSKQLLEFLQSVPAGKLAGVRPNVLASEDIDKKVLKMLHFTPVIEKTFEQEQFLTEDPEKVLREHETNQKEIMIGHTNSEGILEIVVINDIFKLYSQYAELLVPRKIQFVSRPDEILEVSDIVYDHYFGSKAISKDTAQKLVNYINDSAYGYEIHRYVQILLSVGKRNVFVYKFSGESERNIYGKMRSNFNLTGASHMDDLAYLFDPKSANLPINKNSKEYKMIQLITKLYTDFAKYGNPTPPGSSALNWPAYDTSNETYMDIGEALTPGKGLDNSVVDFWEPIFKKALLP